MNKRTEKKQNRIKEMLKLESQGYNIKTIAKMLEISLSSLYKYRQEIAIKNIDSLIEKIYNAFKTNYSIVETIESLSFSELSIIARKYGIAGVSRKDKIKYIVDFLKDYIIIGIKPNQPLTKSLLKQQYFRKAKEVHPDLNKNLTGAEFVNLHRAYEYFCSITYC